MSGCGLPPAWGWLACVFSEGSAARPRGPRRASGGGTARRGGSGGGAGGKVVAILQVFEQLLWRLIPGGGILRQHALQHHHQTAGHPRTEEANIGRLFLHVLENPLRRRTLGEHAVAGQHKIQRAAQRVDIAPDVGGAAVAGLLGCHVIDRADRGAERGQAGHVIDRTLLGLQLGVGQFLLADGPGEAEVGELEVRLPILVREEKVGGLDVAVDNALAMGVAKGPRRLDGDRARLVGQELAFAVDVLVQVGALDILHRQEKGAVDLREFVDRDDVLVVEAGRAAGLAPKAFDHARLEGEVGLEDFEGHGPAEIDIHGLVDGSHAPGGDVGLHLVLADTKVATAALARGWRTHGLSCAVPGSTRPWRRPRAGRPVWRSRTASIVTGGNESRQRNGRRRSAFKRTAEFPQLAAARRAAKA